MLFWLLKHYYTMQQGGRFLLVHYYNKLNNQWLWWYCD